MKKLYRLLPIVFVVFNGCSPQRDLVYFSDLSEKYKDNSTTFNNTEPRILENDLLGITINTQSAESNVLFAFNSNNLNKNSAIESEGYRVNKSGDINFPVIGFTKVKGLTIEEAEEAISQKINKYVKNSIVQVQFLNFKITVIGEVNNPSTFTISNEEINLLEALGMAGDMTAYGKRENVLLIRKIGGKRTLVRLNLNKQDILDSPYFYLKQNDVIYVEPDKSKSLEYSPNNRLMPLVVATISAVAVLATTLLSR